MARPARLRLALAATLASLFAVALGARSAEPVAMPGPAPWPRRADAAAENARCEGCHGDIAAEWRGSLHRAAHTDPAYQRALAIEPLAFCRGCHAPEAEPTRDPPPALGAIGVGCVSCHGDTHAGTLAAPRADAPAAPHAVTRAPAFATASACARCHEFSFPDPERRIQPLLMQSTASEHRASPYAASACADCHMPLVGEGRARHVSHAFPASRDASLLRAALRISASRPDAATIEVRLEPMALGHAFPTGDLFRRLEVLAEAVGPEAQVVAEDARYLARRFGRGEGRDRRPIKVMLSDDRVTASGPAVVRLAPGPLAAGFPVRWRVAYQRVEHPIEENSARAVVEGEVVLAEGLLPPP
jgi:hypothetical protein